MWAVKGNKVYEISKNDLTTLVDRFSFVVIDIGTGDGRFVYKMAKKNSGVLFIGVDPSEKQLEVYSKEANKNRLENVLFVVGSVEMLPEELFNTANKIFINLPWGSLLEKIAKPTAEIAKSIKNLLKANGTIDIIFGYLDEAEPSETLRLSLPPITKEYIKQEIAPIFHMKCQVSELTKEELKDLETTWAKKLSFGKDRPIFKLILY